MTILVNDLPARPAEIALEERRGLDPLRARACAQAIALRKRSIRHMIALVERDYDRAKQLPAALDEAAFDGLEEVDFDIGVDWTRRNLSKLGRSLKYRRRRGLPYGAQQQAMVGEASILRKQIGKRSAA